SHGRAPSERLLTGATRQGGRRQPSRWMHTTSQRSGRRFMKFDRDSTSRAFTSFTNALASPTAVFEGTRCLPARGNGTRIAFRFKEVSGFFARLAIQEKPALGMMRIIS